MRPGTWSLGLGWHHGPFGTNLMIPNGPWFYGPGRATGWDRVPQPGMAGRQLPTVRDRHLPDRSDSDRSDLARLSRWPAADVE
jgi:hypothetical protein